MAETDVNDAGKDARTHTLIVAYTDWMWRGTIANDNKHVGQCMKHARTLTLIVQCIVAVFYWLTNNNKHNDARTWNTHVRVRQCTSPWFSTTIEIHY